ncbi:MAG: hypothetical protein ACREXW_20045 [Gammaproteobacteria bacterium]
MVSPRALAPDIEPAILEDTVPPDLTLFDLAVYAPAVLGEEKAMSGTCKRAAFAMVGATVLLVVSAANAGAGASRGPEIRVRIESASQKETLARGLEALVSNKGAGEPIVKVRGSSSTYGVPHFTRLTKTRAVRLQGPNASAPSRRVTVLRLRLTAEGRKQIASCEARTLRVEAGGASDQARLVRDTRRCKPKRSRSISAVPIVDELAGAGFEN